MSAELPAISDLRSGRIRASAFAFAAAIMLIPANVLPVISTSTGGEARTDTIFSGVVALWQEGLEPIAAIVFVASIVIPLLKLVGLAWLLFAAGRRGNGASRRFTRLYAVLDFIGRWSMLDVFLVAFLTGVVRFGILAQVEPRQGIVAFAAAVVLTILATREFDPRWLWLGHDERGTRTS
jgi:paraquat-inducible protein A